MAADYSVWSRTHRDPAELGTGGTVTHGSAVQGLSIPIPDALSSFLRSVATQASRAAKLAKPPFLLPNNWAMPRYSLVLVA